MTNASERWLTVDEVAAELRTAPETVRRWLRAGKIEGVRPGGMRLGWRVPASEVERLLRRSPAAEAS